MLPVVSALGKCQHDAERNRKYARQPFHHPGVLLVHAFSQFVWKMCGLHGVSSTFTATRISTVIEMSRLRARAWMLSTSGAGVQEEGAHREESTAWFARAVQGFPQDSEALTAAGEGLLEYGR